MLVRIFQSLLLTSCVGTMFAGFIALVSPLTKKYFGSGWSYYILLAALALMVLPVRFGIPCQPAADTSVSAGVSGGADAGNAAARIEEPDIETGAAVLLPTAEKRETEKKPGGIGTVKNVLADSAWDAAAVIWLAGAVLLFSFKLAFYETLLRKIHRNTQRIECPELLRYTGRRIAVRSGSGFSSPFMTGFFRPTLILPETPLAPEQLCFVLAHETTHDKRRDVCLKWFAALVKCLHWFNPAVYIICRQIDMECEISCDAAVMSKLHGTEKKGYAETILALLERGEPKNISLTTGMTGGVKQLKRRFVMMKKTGKTGKTARVLSALTAAALLLSAVFASGVLADGVLAEDYRIEIYQHGQKAELSARPFVENGTLYLPLREMLTLEGVRNEDITYNNGVVRFLIRADVPGSIVYRGLAYDFWVNRVRINAEAAYLAGHSEGSTENTLLVRPVLLKDGVTYAPYDLFDKLKESGQGVFQELQAVVTDKSGSTPQLTGSGYWNDRLNFSLEIPLSWSGKFSVLEEENTVVFRQTATDEKYGAGTLFYIERVSGIHSQEEIMEPGNRTIVMRTAADTYVLGRPTDVQYPIWTDHDEEDIAIAAEYETMALEIGAIAGSIREIVHFIPQGSENKMPETVVAEFFKAFSRQDFETMKSYCTEECVSGFWGDGYVFGMTSAKLENMEIDPMEYAKSSNGFNILVTVSMTPAENSVYDPAQTSATFYVCLLRQADGRYFIDEFATGV